MPPTLATSVPLESLRGQVFSEQLALLKQSQFWTAPELAAHQLARLQATLRHCQENIPHYRQAFAKAGVDARDLRRLGDLRAFPFLDKDMIKARPGDFLPRGTRVEDLLVLTTGGSTGDPLKVYMDLDYKALTLANTYYYMDVAGFDPDHYRSVRLHGDTLEQGLVEQGVYWQLREGRKLVMSSHHLYQETLPAYLAQIDALEPHYLHGYPSAVALLAGYLEQAGLRPRRPIATIFCDSEVLYDHQRLLIERTLGGRVYSIYGHTEGAVLGITCPHSRKMHLLPQVGYSELLDQDDLPVTTPGQKGYLVVTGFYNRVMPMVRYRTNDIGVYTEQQCPCGRHYFMLERVEGRSQDYALDRQGRRVPLAPTLFDYNFDWTGIDRFRVVQTSQGRLTFRVVPQAGHDFAALAQRIETSFAALFNKGFDISVERAPALERTQRGKYRYFEQLMAPPAGA